MSNTIEYSCYVDMLLDSADEFEPYGYSVPSHVIAAATGFSQTGLMLHLDSMRDESLDR